MTISFVFVLVYSTGDRHTPPPPVLSQLSIGGHLGCFHGVAILNSATMNMGTCIFSNLCFCLFLDIYPGVELLDHVVA